VAKSQSGGVTERRGRFIGGKLSRVRGSIDIAAVAASAAKIGSRSGEEQGVTILFRPEAN